MSYLIMLVLSFLTSVFMGISAWAYWPSEMGVAFALVACLTGPALWWHLWCRWMATLPIRKGGAYIRYGNESARIVSLIAKINAIFAMNIRPGMFFPLLRDVVQLKRDGTTRYYAEFAVAEIITTKNGGLMFRGYETVYDVDGKKFRIRSFCDDQIIDIGSVDVIDHVVNATWIKTMTNPQNCADCDDAQLGTMSNQTRCKYHV